MADSTNDNDPGLVGWLSLLFFVVLLGFVVWGGYSFVNARWGTPPAAVSLSAYFAGEAGAPDSPGKPSGQYLKIAGQVYRGGKAVQAGIVHLSVDREASYPSQTGYLSESVSVDLVQGKFETPDRDPRFGALNPTDQLHILADVSSPEIPEGVAAALYLNVPPPPTVTRSIQLISALVFLMGVFFYSFTGRKTPRKNRIAIWFSYGIIVIFLAGPLVAPVWLLRAYPFAYHDMIGRPAGLLVTVVGDPAEVCKDNKAARQWALNISGYSYEGDPCTRSAVPPGDKPTDNAKNPKPPELAVTPGAHGAPTPQGGVTTQTSKSLTASGMTTPTDATGNTEKHPNPSEAGKKEGTAALNSATTPKSADANQPVVVIEGGLVIPFFVIVLSMIGGAINMTRKVPRYQREGEYAEMTFSAAKLTQQTMSAASAVVSAVSLRNLVTSGVGSVSVAGPVVPLVVSPSQDEKKTEVQKEPEGGKQPGGSLPADDNTKESSASPAAASLEDQAKDLADKIDTLVTVQVNRNSETDTSLAALRNLVQKMRDLFDGRKPDDPPLLKFETFEDWLGTRGSLKELLGSNWRVELLYQYMYLISAPFLAIVAYYMLDLLGLTKQPVVVVLSFSVGLISEKIVAWILGIATGYLRTNVGGQPGAKAGAAA